MAVESVGAASQRSYEPPPPRPREPAAEPKEAPAQPPPQTQGTVDTVV